MLGIYISFLFFIFDDEKQKLPSMQNIVLLLCSPRRNVSHANNECFRGEGFSSTT